MWYLFADEASSAPEGAAAARVSTRSRAVGEDVEESKLGIRLRAATHSSAYEDVH